MLRHEAVLTASWALFYPPLHVVDEGAARYRHGKDVEAEGAPWE